MTTRSDLPRLAASLGVLGTVLEHTGQTAWDHMSGWEHGPRKAPAASGDDVCTCGHSAESHIEGHDVCAFSTDDLNERTDDGMPVHLCFCGRFTAAPRTVQSEDRHDEAIQRARAARHFQEFRTDLAAIDKLAQELLRRVDVACPPNPEDVKNRKTNDLDPVTPADVAAAGWCSSCWRNDQQMVAREKSKKSGLYVSATLCRWCLDVKRTYGVEPPLDMLKLHHAGRRISVTAMEEAVAKAKPASKAKSKKRRKGKQAA